MPPAVIRRAVQADVQAIHALTDAAYAKFIPRIGRKPQPMTADYARMVEEHQVWLLIDDERTAGVLVLMAEAEQLLINSVAIDPACQKRGYGRQLLAWAEAQALAQGYGSIRLFSINLALEPSNNLDCDSGSCMPPGIPPCTQHYRFQDLGS